MLDKITVLYIEDDIDILEEIAFFLEKKVSTLHVASNGEEGLSMFREFTPDIIITDIQMPKMNGLDMIAVIREENSEVPIIITSAFNESEKLLKAINLGVDAYLLKPINMAKLYKKVQKLMRPIILKTELEKSKTKLALMNQLKEKEKELLSYKERMEYAFIGSNDGLWDWNVITGEAYLSPRWKAIIGYKDSEIENNITSWETSVYPDDLILAKEELHRVFTHEKKLYKIEFRQIHKDGHLVWVLARGMVKFDKSGKPLRMIGTHIDITEKKEVQQKLEKLSVTDSLTKLYNRRYFNEILPKEINRTKRDKKNMAFLMLDVDFFKLYNDNYGHAMGDKTLISIAKVLIDFAKREGDYAFRLGGEEFGILFSSKTIEDAQHYAQNLIEAIEALNIVHEYSIVSRVVTFSAGLMLKKYDDDLSTDDIYKKADVALYEAKAFGRNQVRIKI